MTFNPNWSGWAEQSSFVEVATGGPDGYPIQETTPSDLTNKKFAKAVYDVSNSPHITETYKDGTTSYICEAPIGTALATPNWRIRKEYVNNDGGACVRWANNGLTGIPATSMAIVSGGPWA